MGIDFDYPPDSLQDIWKFAGFLALSRICGSVLRSVSGGPTCIGELMGGLLMGPVILDVAPFPNELVQVGLLGLIALQFIVGGKVQLDNVWMDSNKVFGAAFLFAFLPGLLTYMVMLAFRFPQKESIAGGIVMLPASTRSAIILHTVIEPFEKVSSSLLIPAAFISDCISLVAMATMRNVDREGWWPPLQSVIMSVIGMNLAVVFRRITPTVVEPTLLSLTGFALENQTRVLVLEMTLFVVAGAVLGGMMLAFETLASSYILGALLAGIAVGQPRSLPVLMESRITGLLSWLSLAYFASSAGFSGPSGLFTDVESILGGLAIAGVGAAGRVLPTLALTQPVRDMDASRLSRACQAATCLLAREELSLAILLELRHHTSQRSQQMLYWAVIFNSVVGSLAYRVVQSFRATEPDRRYGIGVLWLIRKGKLIVTGFSTSSQAKELGVRTGDILKAVDGHNVLFMVPDEEGNHEARKLLRGPEGSYCKLELLRLTRKGAATASPGEWQKEAEDSRNRQLDTVIIHVPRVAEIEAQDPGVATY